MGKIVRTNISFKQNLKNINNGIVGNGVKEFYICGNNLSSTGEVKFDPRLYNYHIIPRTLKQNEIETIKDNKVIILNSLCCENAQAYKNEIPLPYTNSEYEGLDLTNFVIQAIEIVDHYPNIGCIEECTNSGYIEWFNKTTDYKVFSSLSEAEKYCSEPTVVVEKPKENGCTDPNALNYQENFIGCFNDNGIIVKDNKSCCMYPINQCLWDGTTNVCTTTGSYFGEAPNLSESIARGIVCNSGETCCEFLDGGEFRSDYDQDSTLGVCSDYNPNTITEKQVSITGYDSIVAFQNAITDGIMCNCFCTKPKININKNYGQRSSKILFDKSDWPGKTVRSLSEFEHTYISKLITHHPPNIYVDFKTCGYPESINAFRKPTSQILDSQSRITNNTYNDFYGDTPKKVTQDKQRNHFTIPNNVIENTVGFDDGLKSGNNVITINCANGKQMMYSVCVPHQTLPYENNMWKTVFFACDTNEVDASDKEYATINFSPKEIDIISSYQKQTNDDGTINLEAIKFLSCKKCGGGFGICGKGSCIGAKCCPPMITIKIPL